MRHLPRPQRRGPGLPDVDAPPAGRLPGVGSSIGVAAFAGEQAPTADDLLDAADSAMYRAKASGGGVSVSG
jgi:GGDEF domain-containing protein